MVGNSSQDHKESDTTEILALFIVFTFPYISVHFFLIENLVLVRGLV